MEDINEQTYQVISERLAAGNTPGLYERVLGEACNIRTALTQCQRTDVGTPRLTPVMPMVGNSWGGESWSDIACTGKDIQSLEDYVVAQEAYIVKVKAEGAAGLKLIANPYGRPDAEAARSTFVQLRDGAIEQLPWQNPLHDFMVDESIRLAGEHDLVVAVHTGYWGDFRLLDPTHMIPDLAAPLECALRHLSRRLSVRAAGR